MNKLTLSCFKSLVQTRPKGDWYFLTKLIVIWPEARAYYWTKQGFRTLLSSWPFSEGNTSGSPHPYLCLPEGRIFHGFLIDEGFYYTIRIYDQGEYLMQLIGKNLAHKGIPWNQADMQAWVYQKPDTPVLLHTNPLALDQLYKEFPWAQQRVIQALTLAREMGITNVKILNILAALTHQGLNRNPNSPELNQEHE